MIDKLRGKWRRGIMFNEYEVSVLRGKNSRGLLDNNVNTVSTPRL